MLRHIGKNFARLAAGIYGNAFAAILPLNLSVVVLLGVVVPVRGQEWSGKINGYEAYIPDVSKPVRAAMVNSLAFDDNDWRSVAKKYNCLMLHVALNHRECPAIAKNIVLALRQASKDFSNHAEIQYTCVSLFGWSASSAAACRIANQPELTNRVLAVVAIHEIDTQPWLPPLSVPHLFISAARDVFSELKGEVESARYTHDAAVRDRATDEGAPLSMVMDVNHGHTDVYNNYAFTRVWLEEVFERRLPAVPPTNAPVVMPDWRNHDGWLGTYDVTNKTGVFPWGEEQRLVNVVIAARSEYRDSRKYLWLPSQRCAEVWQVYAMRGMMPAYGTLTPPEPAAPKILVQPQGMTLLPDQHFAFTATTIGTPPPTYEWWRVNGGDKKLVSSMPNCFNFWDPTTNTDYGATFYLVAKNCAGSVISDKVTLTLSTNGTTPPAILIQPVSATVDEGRTATFSVQAQETPAPYFQWQRDGVDIPGATAAYYTTPPAVAGDDGAAFRIVITNSYGCVTSSPAMLELTRAKSPDATSPTFAFEKQSKEERDARMAWWREARFGMFIH